MTTNGNEIIDRKSLLSLNGSMVTGVLVFLTLSRFTGIEWQVVGIFTVAAIMPFIVSAGILISNEMILFPKILFSRWYKTTISKRYKSISPERILGMAKFCTFGGFFYLVVILFVVVFTFPTEPSACPRV